MIEMTNEQVIAMLNDCMVEVTVQRASGSKVIKTVKPELHQALNDKMRETLVANLTTYGARMLFQTKKTTATEDVLLFELGLLETGSEAFTQANKCNVCNEFIAAYGGLVFIDEEGELIPAIWPEPEQVHPLYAGAMARVRERLVSAEIKEPFRFSGNVLRRQNFRVTNEDGTNTDQSVDHLTLTTVSPSRLSERNSMWPHFTLDTSVPVPMESRNTVLGHPEEYKKFKNFVECGINSVQLAEATRLAEKYYQNSEHGTAIMHACAMLNEARLIHSLHGMDSPMFHRALQTYEFATLFNVVEGGFDIIRMLSKDKLSGIVAERTLHTLHADLGEFVDGVEAISPELLAAAEATFSEPLARAALARRLLTSADEDVAVIPKLWETGILNDDSALIDVEETEQADSGELVPAGNLFADLLPASAGASGEIISGEPRTYTNMEEEANAIGACASKELTWVEFLNEVLPRTDNVFIHLPKQSRARLAMVTAPKGKVEETDTIVAWDDPEARNPYALVSMAVPVDLMELPDFVRVDFISSMPTRWTEAEESEHTRVMDGYLLFLRSPFTLNVEDSLRNAGNLLYRDVIHPKFKRFANAIEMLGKRLPIDASQVAEEGVLGAISVSAYHSDYRLTIRCKIDGEWFSYMIDNLD